MAEKEDPEPQTTECNTGAYSDPRKDLIPTGVAMSSAETISKRTEEEDTEQRIRELQMVRKGEILETFRLIRQASKVKNFVGIHVPCYAC